jgi:hypothetical protein
MERGAGPGRGKKDVNALTSFRALLEQIKVDKQAAVEAQRVACLFRPEETLEFRLKRFLARWRLGEALAPMERGTPGPKSYVSRETQLSFRSLLKDIKVDPKSAMEAQRVSCLPFPELEKFCNVARWRLGEARAPMERGAGPGRGKKDLPTGKSFMGLLERLRLVPRAAQEAQRIACLPFAEFGKFCASARKSGDALAPIEAQ